MTGEKWKETTWVNLGLCGTTKDDSEKCAVRFKWVRTGSEKVPIAEPCGFGTKERRMSVRDEYLRTCLGSPLIGNKQAYELNYQDRQRTYNVTVGHVRATIVAVRR
jgi:hypothetical protein